MDPIELQRMLQGRTEAPDDRPPPPDDGDLKTAVARMTDWAKHRGRDRLVMAASDWQALVLEHLYDVDTLAFYKEVLTWLPEPLADDEVEQLQALSGLLTNIWNNTPQPDRGGRTANELVPLRYGS